MKGLQYKQTPCKVINPTILIYEVEYSRNTHPMLCKVHYIFKFLMEKVICISWILDASNPPHKLGGGGEEEACFKAWKVYESNEWVCFISKERKNSTITNKLGSW